MSMRTIKFKVTEGNASERGRRRYFAHIAAGNHETTWQAAIGDGFNAIASAFKTCESTWIAFAKAQGHPLAQAPFERAVFLARLPVPYTKDSLRPMPKRTVS